MECGLIVEIDGWKFFNKGGEDRSDFGYYVYSEEADDLIHVPIYVEKTSFIDQGTKKKLYEYLGYACSDK